jgi:hypothetical protein
LSLFFPGSVVPRQLFRQARTPRAELTESQTKTAARAIPTALDDRFEELPGQG